MKRNTNNKLWLCFGINKAYSILFLVLVTISNATLLLADFDLQKYTDKSAIVATYPINLINPPCRIERNKFTFINIKKCLLARLEFVLGINPDLNSTRCYKVQSSINKSIEAFQLQHKQNPIKYIDDNIIFNPDSPLRRATIPKEKTSLYCSYTSCCDLSKNGFIYCKYHGTKFGSKAYKRYQKEIEASNTGMITPDDLVDITIILPLLLFPIITWIILMKVLSSTKKKAD